MAHDRLTPEGRRFYEQLQKLSRMEVRVGYQTGEATDDDGVDMCDIAAWNELGTEHSPARPFLRQTVENNESKINAFCAREARKMIEGGTVEQCLDRIGVFIKGLVQKTIQDGEFEPNAASTIKKKGSDHPLIDTGRMRQSVNYHIKEKGGE